MAYSDYGAFVHCNGERRKDKEDVALFATDEETFGTDSENVPSGLRIWISALKAKEDGEKENPWVTQSIHHGIMGDGDIRVLCHKQGLPEIYEILNGEINKVKFCDDDTDYYDYDPIHFDYKEHHFFFREGNPYYAEMTTPDGTIWTCEYDYGFGAGFD